MDRDDTLIDDNAAEPILRLARWDEPIDPSDPDANFKAELAQYSLLDPLETLRGMSEGIGVPVGAVARYVLARWATGGSAGLLEVGPDMVKRLQAVFGEAETAGTDSAKLYAYEQIKAMVSWLAAPLDDDSYYSP